MLAVRVIATMLIDPARGVIKGRQFVHDRVIGDPINWVRVMAGLRDVDELVVLDVTSYSPDFTLLERIAAEAAIPVAYGGGIYDVETALRVLRTGAEKVILDPRWRHLYKPIGDRAGVQAVVAEIRRADELGPEPIGEVLLQSLWRDGTMVGYDLGMIREVRAVTTVPIIASSGAGSPADCVAAMRAGADAVAIGAMFAFTDTTPDDVKRALAEAGYPVRLAASPR